jgi:hypothetical protein
MFPDARRGCNVCPLPFVLEMPITNAFDSKVIESLLVDLSGHGPIAPGLPVSFLDIPSAVNSLIGGSVTIADALGGNLSGALGL